MVDPNLRLLEEASTRLASFLPEIVFVGGVTLGLLITDKAAAPSVEIAGDVAIQFRPKRKDARRENEKRPA